MGTPPTPAEVGRHHVERAAELAEIAGSRPVPADLSWWACTCGWWHPFGLVCPVAGDQLEVDRPVLAPWQRGVLVQLLGAGAAVQAAELLGEL